MLEAVLKLASNLRCLFKALGFHSLKICHDEALRRVNLLRHLFQFLAVFFDFLGAKVSTIREEPDSEGKIVEGHIWGV
jgi:hypothetical protein